MQQEKRERSAGNTSGDLLVQPPHFTIDRQNHISEGLNDLSNEREMAGGKNVVRSRVYHFPVLLSF